MNKGLGRIHSPDPRDGKYLLSRRDLKAAPTSKMWTASSPILDQGETSQCVIYATDKFLTASPVKNKSFGSNDDRANIYKIVQTFDEWPGDDYDGTSVRGAMKYLQSVNLVSEYRWAFDVELALAHLLTTGPLVMGTNWYADMFEPDKKGYVHVNGDIAGGHAYVAIGADRNRQNPDGSMGAVRCINSWGKAWGQAGRFWVTFKDFDRLIKEQGEAATPAEVKVG